MSNLFVALRKVFRSKSSPPLPEDPSRRVHSESRSSATKSTDVITAMNSTDMTVMEESGTASTTSHFRWMDGRRFNVTSGIHYVMPNDATESDRMMLEHFMLREMFQGRNFHAPIGKALKAGIKVLDFGCGPGTWSLEMATDYPNSQFIGIDIADGFPESIRPINCEFRIVNVRHQLPFEDMSFDYIFIRNMAFTIAQTDLPEVFQEIFRILRPGGVVEMVEMDIEQKRRGPQSKMGNSRMIHGLQARGIDVYLARTLDSFLAENGFSNPQTNFGSIPIGWGGKLGEAMQQNIELSMAALKTFYTSALNYTNEQFDALVEAMKVENVQYESYSNYHYAFASRPLS
ncbi:S-adenosyl-L-methionine-dependent methyltransferase [Jimgerdemannia flammicorona]|uniref:S-adenosyl-L-methionine-dependent methyltransferase n=1 Tax=Jimgerdemannia flammicorona TaxID=994334 RepID=A0A433QIJ2_9FUNG|nr:S-adenosyl-L-methionine-dependent methyltransferase [Jimgerdemannia flammicorona]